MRSSATIAEDGNRNRRCLPPLLPELDDRQNVRALKHSSIAFGLLLSVNANADKEPGRWMTTGRDFGKSHYSPLAEIQKENVCQLGFALEHSNGATHFCVDLRAPRLRLSRPANQRFVSLAPNKRRSLLRRSAFLRNLHEQFFGIVQAAKGRRGASCSR